MIDARMAAAAAAFVLYSGCATHPPAVPQPAAEAGMFVIGGGRFTMGRDEGELNERPAHKVEIDTFAMDRTEVAAGDFAEFLNAVGNPGDLYFTSNEYATVVVTKKGDGVKETRFSARPGYERYPANNVSWHGADAYCRWRGKRLPTEAEWEKAARGTDQRRFPWGKDLPGEQFAQFEKVWQEKRFDVFVPVDALPSSASPYGMLNMSGNALEWVNDWYRQNLCDFCNPDREPNLELILQLTDQDADTFDADPTAAGTSEAARKKKAKQSQAPPRNNPRGPTTGSFMVLRGGSWQDRQEYDLSTTRRFWLDPAQRFPHTGFRCSQDDTRKDSSVTPSTP